MDRLYELRRRDIRACRHATYALSLQYIFSQSNNAARRDDHDVQDLAIALRQKPATKQ